MKTRGEKVCQFIEAFCPVPEGKLVGQPLKLMKFQREFILDIYDNPKGTSRAYLSVGRKNGKSALIAATILAHTVGPEARQNSQITSGARSRDQAALVFKLAEKMVRLSPRLSQIIKIVPSQKSLVGLPMNVEYKAISAEAGTAHGLSPVLAILDEVGQVRGPTDSFIEAIETAQGAHDDPLLIAISTQAATDGDLFSIWLDDAKNQRQANCLSLVHRARGLRNIG
jgi:phage terminase large subunit-like protein